jgi:putative membrane protein
MMHGFYGGFGGPGFQQISWWWMAMGLIRWVIIGLAVYLIYRAVVKNRHASSAPEDSALSTLRERYARGEIDETTYDRMMQKLKEPNGR